MRKAVISLHFSQGSWFQQRSLGKTYQKTSCSSHLIVPNGVREEVVGGALEETDDCVWFPKDGNIAIDSDDQVGGRASQILMSTTRLTEKHKIMHGCQAVQTRRSFARHSCMMPVISGATPGE